MRRRPIVSLTCSRQITSWRRLVAGDRSSQPLSRHPAMASFTVVAGPHDVGLASELISSQSAGASAWAVTMRANSRSASRRGPCTVRPRCFIFPESSRPK